MKATFGQLLQLTRLLEVEADCVGESIEVKDIGDAHAIVGEDGTSIIRRLRGRHSRSKIVCCTLALRAGYEYPYHNPLVKERQSRSGAVTPPRAYTSIHKTQALSMVSADVYVYAVNTTKAVDVDYHTTRRSPVTRSVTDRQAGQIETFDKAVISKASTVNRCPGPETDALSLKSELSSTKSSVRSEASSPRC